MAQSHPAFDALTQYPLWEALFNRRSRRVSKGLKSIRAGSNTYTSDQKPQPLTPLEEAVLIAATGATGFTMPDRPFQDDQGNKILGTPNLTMFGRAAGSPDNAQATHFFLINDTGTYFLKRLDPPDSPLTFTPDELIRRAELCKHKVLDGRLVFDREFPYYLDSNRFLSNLEGPPVRGPVAPSG